MKKKEPIPSTEKDTPDILNLVKQLNQFQKKDILCKITELQDNSDIASNQSDITKDCSNITKDQSDII